MRAPLLALVVLALGMCSCASGPDYADIEHRIPPVPSDQGRVVFYRTAVVGAMMQPNVMLNGHAVGKATPRGFFFVDSAPGDCVVTCTTESDHELSFLLDASRTRFVRLDLQPGFLVGRVVPKLVEPEEARGELQGMSYTGDEAGLLPESLPDA